MPRPNYAKPTLKFENFKKASTSAGEANDCAVIAIAAACKVSYKRAHKVLADLGRKDGAGAPMLIILQAAKTLGFNLTPVDIHERFINNYPDHHKGGFNSATMHHPARFPEQWEDGKVYLAFTKKHVSCINNGKVDDWACGTKRSIQELYEVTPV